MPSRLQIFFRWETCFILAGNQDNINRTLFGWEIRTLYSCEFYESLRSWNVRFWCSHLPKFFHTSSRFQLKKLLYSGWEYIPYKYELIWLSIINTFHVWIIRNLKNCAFISDVCIWYCYLCHSNRFQMTDLLYFSWK
jgi:hypothetical protein